MLIDLMQLNGLSLWPNARAGEFYGISALYRKDRGPFMTDLPILFDLLGAGKLKLRIGAKLPLLEAAQANELLENGQVSGKIVLLASELLQEHSGGVSCEKQPESLPHH